MKKKLKKKNSPLTLKLVPTRDILYEVSSKLARAKRSSKVLVGFALETENLLKNAKEKMRRKGLDLIAANVPGTAGAKTIRGFLINRSGETKKINRMDKRKFARILWNSAKEAYVKKSNP